MPEQRDGFIDLTADEFDPADPSFLILDVRTPAERAGPLGFIAGSHDCIHTTILDKSCFRNDKWMSSLKKDSKIIVHCRSGVRAQEAIHKLKELGYNNLYHLKGGMLAWQEKKKPIVYLKQNTAASQFTGSEILNMVRICFFEEVEKAEGSRYDRRWAEEKYEDLIAKAHLIGIDNPDKRELEVLIRLLGEAAKENGHAIDMITKNTAEMQSILYHCYKDA
mmetsp:Transcript_17547/g.43732  ORF Transcript_17547/g.43732 Transcript_17547/m.43732 type:complete len:221 (-) Transcript_17547:278-940(-)|eukprot:CAMPEP_0113879516 /NCGR_PEP_ID=MMETSP0780_2-20120614/7280_1 /TAXON_ID=652834 /ORGANISM="Palpitomonas bilix" /LENGTH=220 /DNA_ID=CAMNT_0000866103 /DNA_START=23 /DNA_END=685 /DNA_ORIENTATION=- /assembly_acc=CAM_ASM_000599